MVSTMTEMLRLRTVAALVSLAGLGSACIITTSGDDSGQSGTDGGDDGVDDGVPATTDLTTGLPPGDDDGVDDDGPSDDTGTTGGELPEECSENLVGEPSFEGGTPSPAWDEASELFGTPICDGGCSEDPGAVAHSGDWWVWFGGSETEPEVASVAQSVTIPEGDVAQLSLWVSVTSAAGTGNDVLAVSLDEVVVFMITDADMPDYDGYTNVALDVTDFADGGEHQLLIETEISGAGLTSFFVDDVELVSCVEPGGSTGDSTAGDSTAGDSTAGDGSTSDASTGTGSTGDASTGSSSGTAG